MSATWTLLLFVAACAGPDRGQAPPASPTQVRPAVARESIELTYLGVAGWQLAAGGRTILIDPYFSRPDLDAPLTPDPEAIRRRAPPRADLILIGHSHADHLLDGPAVAAATGAQILGSASTARVARASGLAADRVITVKGGEDFAMDGFSVRVLPSLHSALDAKHTFGGEIAADPVLPLRFADYQEGGTFAYLVRIGGHEVFLQSTANFIEREIDGLRPDIAVLASGLREEIHDYTCRLLHALGNPPLVYVNHFDDWHAPPTDQPVPDDVTAFVAEVKACAPGTRVVVPRHFEKMIVPWRQHP